MYHVNLLKEWKEQEGWLMHPDPDTWERGPPPAEDPMNRKVKTSGMGDHLTQEQLTLVGHLPSTTLVQTQMFRTPHLCLGTTHSLPNWRGEDWYAEIEAPGNGCCKGRAEPGS